MSFCRYCIGKKRRLTISSAGEAVKHGHSYTLLVDEYSCVGKENTSFREECVHSLRPKNSISKYMP
jgi:hypothetical protein